jgi:hypothetical protein
MVSTSFWWQGAVHAEFAQDLAWPVPRPNLLFFNGFAAILNKTGASGPASLSPYPAGSASIVAAAFLPGASTKKQRLLNHKSS